MVGAQLNADRSSVGSDADGEQEGIPFRLVMRQVGLAGLKRAGQAIGSGPAAVSGDGHCTSRWQPLSAHFAERRKVVRWEGAVLRSIHKPEDLPVRCDERAAG